MNTMPIGAISEKNRDIFRSGILVVAAWWCGVPSVLGARSTWSSLLIGLIVWNTNGSSQVISYLIFENFVFCILNFNKITPVSIKATVLSIDFDEIKSPLWIGQPAHLISILLKTSGAYLSVVCIPFSASINLQMTSKRQYCRNGVS